MNSVVPDTPQIAPSRLAGSLRPHVYKTRSPHLLFPTPSAIVQFAIASDKATQAHWPFVPRRQPAGLGLTLRCYGPVSHKVGLSILVQMIQSWSLLPHARPLARP